MTFLEEPADSSGGAADTGTAVHTAVKAFHSGDNVVQAMDKMIANVKEYPLAAMEEAAAMFLSYSADRRNLDAQVILCERPITYEIAAAETDPTGAPIVVEGTADQVRRVNGRLELWDLKTSKMPPEHVRHATTLQAAGYCIGCTYELKETVHPGGVIMPRKYDGAKNKSEAKVFIHFAWEFQDIEQILLPLRLRVADIRAGRLYHIPTDGGCMFCRMKSPDLCLPRLKRTKVALEEAKRAEALQLVELNT